MLEPAEERAAKTTSARSYKGLVQLHLESITSNEAARQLQESLSKLDKIQVKAFGGSQEEGTFIIVFVEEELPLAQLLSDLEIVNNVFEKKLRTRHQIKSLLKSRVEPAIELDPACNSLKCFYLITSLIFIPIALATPSP